MRALVRAILARRTPEPPAEYVALQVSRLNEALLVAYSAMSGTNLRAVDRVVRIVRELDRYHGFVAVEHRFLSDALRIEAQASPALDMRLTDPLHMALQPIEKAQFTPGDGAAPQASVLSPGGETGLAAHAEDARARLNERRRMAPKGLKEAGSGPGEEAATRQAFAPSPEAPAKNPPALDGLLSDGPEKAPQQTEKVEFAPENNVAEAASALAPGGNEVAPAGPAEDSLLTTPVDDSFGRAGSGPEVYVPHTPVAFAPSETPAEDLPAPPNGLLTDRLEVAPQALEMIEFAPGNGMAAERARASQASFASETAQIPIGARMPNVRSSQRSPGLVKPAQTPAQPFSPGRRGGRTRLHRRASAEAPPSPAKAASIIAQLETSGAATGQGAGVAGFP